jgi:hypothetical protein
MAIADALQALTVDEVADALHASIDPSIIAAFEAALPTALDGGFASVRVITATWDRLLSEAIHSSDMAGLTSLDVTTVDVLKLHGRPDWLGPALRAAVADAPFSRFVGRFGPGVGMAAACVARVRDALPELSPIAQPAGDLPEFGETTDVLRFHRLVDLAIRGLEPPLERLQGALSLSSSELGDVFGVSRQAIDQWRGRGIPSDRQGKVGDLVAVVDLLERKVKPGRLPLIARRPAPALGGQTLLEYAKHEDARELREIFERAFDWSTTA